MLLILIQTIIQAVSSTLTWLGFYVGIRVVGRSLFPIQPGASAIPW